MYKVFINDSVIILASSDDISKDSTLLSFKDFRFEDVKDTFTKNENSKLTYYCDDLEKDWQRFCRNFKLIPAAGGLVVNGKNEMLFIYRHNIWDLPKGRIEAGETVPIAAVREVEEECGISDLKLKEKLIVTYHIYFHKSYKLKETHWYLMYSDYDKKLTPQIEEGITDVGFKNEFELPELFKNTYANIKLVYDTYKNQQSSKK